ncbi:MAG TPA: flagellar basal body P-ring formation chaperone FlgA [Rhodoblastus sp.]|nr:flagellar basal body P-ring formation chaperone FlgA [Rhodoblastus sp.]
MTNVSTAFAGFLLFAVSSAGAQEIAAPCPRATIYPGETIRSDMLTETFVDARDAVDVARQRVDLIGYIARRTLFAGRPISFSSIEDPKTIANGSAVQLVYERPGVSINASGQALQSARVGDPIRVRNVESGLVVTGVVASSGVVQVGR